MLCLHYDPSTGKYGWAIMGTLRIAGLLTVALMAGFVILMLRRDRHMRGSTAGQAALVTGGPRSGDGGGR